MSDLLLPKPNSRGEKGILRKQRADEHYALKLEIEALDGHQCRNPHHRLWIEQFQKFGKGFPRPTDNLECSHLIPRSLGGLWTPENCITFCGCCNYWSDEGLTHPLHGRITAVEFKVIVLRYWKVHDPIFRHNEALDKLETRYGEITK